MPNKNAIVALVLRIDPPIDRPTDDRGYTIELEGERRARIEPGDKNGGGLARILDGLRELRRPVYLELDPATSAITRLLIPHVTRVSAIKPFDNGVFAVELELSHARHVLRRTADDAAEIERLLRGAIRTRTPVVVTETDAHEIIDVRPYTPVPGEELPHFPRPEFPARVPWSIDWFKYLWWRLWCWRCWPWWWFRCLSLTRAQQVFDAMAATTLQSAHRPAALHSLPLSRRRLLGPRERDVPADDQHGSLAEEGVDPGQPAREHEEQPELRRVLGLARRTDAVCARPKFFQSQQMVIDPSLFTTPVSEATWKGVQGDPGATLTPSAASIFYLWGNVTDPAYVQTNQELATYRLQLQNRSLGPSGPPPYAGCP